MQMGTSAVLISVLAFCCACQRAPRSEPKPSEPKLSESPAAEPPAPLVPAPLTFGWLDENCLVVTNAALPNGTPLFVATLGATPSIMRATVDHAVSEGEPCNPLRPHRRSGNEEPGTSFYWVSLPEPLQLGIAVVAAAPASLANGQLDLNGDGRPERFRYCATTHSIEFSVWSDEPYRGTPLWSGYYYLGYELEADCPQP